ncbi:unnamed protein product [Clonostachys byssicola]|uniref:Major facilitator superfamily (MFS) profile domain-containing protein n=1 Tax=Clonostachys byssicola TaxID=160290 RepID=A0A9N9U408_9HYPO|nr:unnamed protein product [Clonostachys byssicola]
MTLKRMILNSTLGQYINTIRNAPRELIFNRRLLLTVAMYAMSGIPITWDQGSVSVIYKLPSWQAAFGYSDASQSAVSNMISFVWITCGLASGLCVMLNDRIGRLWSFRLYSLVYMIGQLIATFSNGNIGALIAARLVAGAGIGPLTVTGPLSIVEIAPTEARGLLTVWFSIVMLASLTLSTFVPYGVYVNMPTSTTDKLQYQIVYFLPIILLTPVILSSFFLSESPRWLVLQDRHEEAAAELVRLRGLPETHPRVASELASIRDQISEERARYGQGGSNWKSVLRETFLVRANLRRVQMAFMAYALAQLSGANAVTSYLVKIFTLLGMGNDVKQQLFLSSMYSFAKFWFTIIASFFFIDALGRRMSLFIGISLQLISHLYLGIFIKFRQEGAHIPSSASQAAIAAIFIHGFGFAIGLLVLPYVFGAEIWPNQIRSFGSSFTQLTHWFFAFGISKGMPSILTNMDNWGAFIFFAGWCLVSLIYVFFTVPELAGVSVEQLDDLFTGPWWQIYKKSRGWQAKDNNVLQSVKTNGSGQDNVDEPDGGKVKIDAQANKMV